jgi:hypothetical protein
MAQMKTPAGGIVAESPSQYRPRHPERSAFYQLFENHFDSYVRAYEERFEPQSEPLRSVVARSVEDFLSCGRLQGGFARMPAAWARIHLPAHVEDSRRKGRKSEMAFGDCFRLP